MIRNASSIEVILVLFGLRTALNTSKIPSQSVLQVITVTNPFVLVLLVRFVFHLYHS